MAEGEIKVPILGKDKILMFRKLADASKGAAARLALQTSHEIGETREIEVTQTKDGAITTAGGLETVISIEAISTRDAVNKMLHDAVVNGDVLEIWEIDFGAEPVTSGVEPNLVTQYPAKYGQGMLNSWTLPDDVESHETISTEFTVSGVLQEGLATISDAQAAQVIYAFRDVTAAPAV